MTALAPDFGDWRSGYVASFDTPICYTFYCPSGWSVEWMALAYRRPSIVEIFQAHLQTLQKPHPPGLRSASVSDPVQSGQAQQRFASWSRATALSNTCSTNGNRR